ncbi:MAG TPA: NFACT RNA binding domain-containing protein [Pyrinomonadaceae bacterium]|jgi:predicted ribosome quality control (RQC) complex YloA/Tae2 family protein
MDDATISEVVSEITPLLVGRGPGKIFQLTPQSLAIDFGLRAHGYLFISVEPAQARLYLIKRRVRDLEKQSGPLNQFGLSLRKELSRTRLSSVQKQSADRVVWFKFEGANELGHPKQRTLVAQLTGRSANLLLLDNDNVIISQLRKPHGAGQTIGDKYQQPAAQQIIKATGRQHSDVGSISTNEGKSISEQLDARYTELLAERAAQSQVANARAQLRKEISRRKKLVKQLESDLAEHVDAEQQKRLGDLLLANVSMATRKGSRLTLIDYFTDGAPKMEIEIDEKLSIAEEAARRFEKYARSKRARKQIASRIAQVKLELTNLEAQLAQLTSATADSPAVQSSLPARPSGGTQTRHRSTKRIPGTRRYLSSDGYEILVGRAARDNDNLTFKIAKPNDLWLHAADYPGSHVIVRNPTRKEIPHRTIIEAAQLAAYFSRANKDPKVDVHYTQRKFLSKPKGAAPGLVRLSRFKSITVAPVEAAERIT